MFCIPRPVPVLYLHSNNPFLVTSPSSLCLTNTFQSISQAIADPLEKETDQRMAKKTEQNVFQFQFPATFHFCRLLECFPLAPLQHYVVLLLFRTILSVGSRAGGGGGGGVVKRLFLSSFFY